MKDRSQLVKGVTDLLVLAVLKKQSAHGYAISERLSDLGLDYLSDAAIYGTLKRLRSQGLVDASLSPSDSGPPRRMFEITDVGRNRLRLGLNDLEQLLSVLRDLSRESPLL